MTLQWADGPKLKVGGIALLALLSMISLAEVNELVGERQGRATDATRQIAERWGAFQVVRRSLVISALMILTRRVEWSAMGKRDGGR